MSRALWFYGGIFFGTTIAVFAVALCAAASESDHGRWD